jgi:hypothetical protein
MKKDTHRKIGRQGSRKSLSRTTVRLVLAIEVVFLTADAARAGFLPGPFEFSFFTSALNGFFLLPFQIAGCA